MSEVKKETKTKKTTKVKEEKKETKVTKKETEKKTKGKKEDKVLLNDKDQVWYKSLCKIVKILTKIGKVLLMIFVPFIFLTMIIVPIAFNKFQIEANIIKFDDLNIIVNDDTITFKIGDDTHIIEADAQALDKITTFLTDNSKNSIITYIELYLLLVAIVMILNIYLLGYIEKLFANFVSKHTPFIEENLKYLFRIAIVASVIKFIDLCLNTVDLKSIEFSSLSIYSLLIIYSIYFIFKYAVKLQSENKTKICD